MTGHEESFPTPKPECPSHLQAAIKPQIPSSSSSAWRGLQGVLSACLLVPDSASLLGFPSRSSEGPGGKRLHGCRFFSKRATVTCATKGVGFFKFSLRHVVGAPPSSLCKGTAERSGGH
uniref:Uncharacterized protein n=1 Tax=Sphaerodactylus townsendi TaxID=933632 RepID=A0ACB8ECL9_9SAUR